MNEHESGFDPEAQETRERAVRSLLELANDSGFEITGETDRALREVTAGNISEVMSAWRPKRMRRRPKESIGTPASWD